MQLSLVINSHSSNIKCLKLFIYCLRKYVGLQYFNNIYLFINEFIYDLPDYITQIIYDYKQSFTRQITYCLSKVEDSVLLYCNEDYLFYKQANLSLASMLLVKLINTDLSFIKFVHSDIEIYKIYSDKLFLIDKYCKNNFSQTLSFWKTKDLVNIYSNCPDAEIGVKGIIYGHLEDKAKDVCRLLDIKGVCYYNGEPKRGSVHYDTEIFPHTASALIKGKWNIEYCKILQTLNEDYKQSRM